MTMDDEGDRLAPPAPAQNDPAADLARLAMAGAGSALVGIGGYLHYPPLGFAAAGAMLFSIALVGALRTR